MQPATKYPLGDWSPDSPNYWSEGAITIQNALPTKASPNYESQPSISLSAIGQPNVGTYTANAVKFDGSTTYLSEAANLTGIANGKTGSASFWIRLDSSGAGPIVAILNSGGIAHLNISFGNAATNKFGVIGRNSSGTTILALTTVLTYSPGITWYNILISWNLGTGATNLYVNNVSDANAVTVINDTIDYATTGNVCDVGGNPGIGIINGALSEVWFDTSFIDFSVSGNRAKFISGGLPVNLGSTGQTPTGSSPLLYLKNPASTFYTNSGTGGNFVTNGTLAIASSSPSGATPSQFLGAGSFIDSNGLPHTYTGTSSQLVEITATSANNVSKAAGYSCATYWKFAALNNTVYAVDLADNPQSMTIGGTAFADLAGTPPKAQCIAQWGQQIVLGHTNGGTYGGGTAGLIPYRIWGCAIGNPASWPDPLTNAGQAAQAFVQDLNANYGDLLHMTNGVFMALAFQQTGITRAIYQGAPTVWSFDDYEKKIGLYCPNSVVQIEENRWAFISSAGFYMTDGYTVQPIGHDLVDSTFLADLNTSYLSHVRGSFDPVTKLIKWIYPSVSMTLQGGFVVCDKMIVYNYINKRWGMGMVGQNIDIIFPALTLAYTMEQLDSVNSNLDLITPSLDDPYWNGGVPTVGVFGIQQIGSSGSFASYSGNFSGTPLTATLDTKVINANPGGRSFSSEYKPIVMGTAPTIQGYVGTQNLLTDSVTYIGPGTPETRTGKISQRSDAVYKRYRLVIANGFTNALGVETEEQPSGYA
jgi:hypothetical protein